MDYSGLLRQTESAIQEIKERRALASDNTLRIVFCGSFSVGKSSLINALIDRKDFLPCGVIPVTKQISRIQYGWRLNIIVRTPSERDRHISLKEFQELAVTSPDMIHGVRCGEMIETIIRCPCRILKNDIEFIDTPGFSDEEYEVLDIHTMSAIRNADICIIPFNPLSFYKMGEQALISKVCSACGGNVIFVMNCLNYLNTDEDYRAVMERANTALAQYGNQLIGQGRIFSVVSLFDNKDLGGLDNYIISLAKNGRDRSAIKKAALDAAVNVIAHDAATQLTNALTDISGELKLLNVKHNESLQEQRLNFDTELRKVQTALSVLKEQQKSVFADENCFKSSLEALQQKTNWAKTYRTDSKNAVINGYISMFTALKADVERILSLLQAKTQFQQVDVPKIISRKTFPPKCIVKGKGRIGCAFIGLIAGIVLGTVMIPGIGTVIGAIIGSVIGLNIKRSPDTDTTVQNTARFIKSDIAPLLTPKYNAIFSDAESQIATIANTREFKSGHEDSIAACNTSWALLADAKERLESSVGRPAD